MDHLKSLNPPQREAVLTQGGPLLILAGAGTGKTRVITYRMAELIRRGVPADKILSVTFTNKAAKEMQHRILELLGKKVKPRPIVSTFHALCVGILRQEISALGYPNQFTIYDRGDQESAARTALRDIQVSDKTLKPADLLTVISRWKMTGLRPAQAAESAENDMEFLAAAAYRRYQQNLKACAAVDFDDLLSLTGQIFQDFPDRLRKHQERFEYVQIDEYQDTNGIQFELIEMLVQPHQNLCVVGDDDQSIYAWRGAELKHILNFQNMFPGTKVIRLEDNYRCTDQILALANRLVRHNRERHDKQLRPHKTGPDSVRFGVFADENLEAQRVVEQIAGLIQSGRARPGDFAILFRTNEQPRVFETAMRKQQIPYVIVGTQSFFDRREIRDILSYLKVIVNPRDEIAMLRIINVPTRGIGDTTVARITARAVQNREPFWNAIPAAEAAGELTPAAKAGLQSFRAVLDKYRQKFAASPRQLSHVLKEFIEAIHYEGEVEKQYKEPQQQLLRMASLEELTDAITDYEQHADDPSLASFLQETLLTGRDDEPDKDEMMERDGVKLMTLHSAKGLEFPRVYLVGMEEGLLPHKRSIDAVNDRNAIEEERRLAYVGVTRARDYLTLCRAESRMKWGKRRPSTQSRFLIEMQPDLQ